MYRTSLSSVAFLIAMAPMVQSQQAGEVRGINNNRNVIHPITDPPGGALQGKPIGEVQRGSELGGGKIAYGPPVDGALHAYGTVAAQSSGKGTIGYQQRPPAGDDLKRGGDEAGELRSDDLNSLRQYLSASTADASSASGTVKGINARSAVVMQGNGAKSLGLVGSLQRPPAGDNLRRGSDVARQHPPFSANGLRQYLSLDTRDSLTSAGVVRGLHGRNSVSMGTAGIRSLGKVKGQRRRADQATLGADQSHQASSSAGDATSTSGSGKGLATELQRQPIPSTDPPVQPHPVRHGDRADVQMVSISGRPGVNYAVLVATASGQAKAIMGGMIFGEDPEGMPATVELSLSSELSIFVVPMGR